MVVVEWNCRQNLWYSSKLIYCFHFIAMAVAITFKIVDFS